MTDFTIVGHEWDPKRQRPKHQDDANILIHIGMSGSGKSYGLARAIEEASTRHVFAIFDRMREFSRKLKLRVDHVLVDRRRAFEKAIDAAKKGKGPSVVVWEPESRSGRNHQSMVEHMAIEACEKGFVLVTPEAHRIAPNKSIPLDAYSPELGELASCARHYGAGWWADTQRPSKLHKDVIEQSTVTRIFTIAGKRDIDVMIDHYGKEIEEPLIKVASEFSAGRPGFHVAIDPRNRVPPYLVREPM